MKIQLQQVHWSRRVGSGRFYILLVCVIKSSTGCRPGLRQHAMRQSRHVGQLVENQL